MWDNLKNKKLILGSASPRRAELLRSLDLDSCVRTLPSLDESYPADLPVPQVAEYIARHKATAYISTLDEDEILLTADTVVCVGSVALGKPQSRGEALEMLTQLCGGVHQVYTGVCIAGAQGIIASASESTQVYCAPLSDEELAHYVDRYQPYDKAGGYGIQEWFGMRAIERIHGCYYNVMGLPTALVSRLLSSL